MNRRGLDSVKEIKYNDPTEIGGKSFILIVYLSVPQDQKTLLKS